jgi:signal transduction histidine kinase
VLSKHPGYIFNIVWDYKCILFAYLQDPLVLNCSYMIRIKNILNLGVSESQDLVEANKQKVFNLFIVLALPIIPFVFVFNLVRANYGMAMMNLFQMLVFIIAAWISHKRKYLFLLTYLLILLSLIIFISAILFATGIEYRLLLLLVVGVILFDNSIRFLFFALLIACEFTISKYIEMQTAGIYGMVLNIKILQIFMPLLIAGISLFYLKYIYLQSQFKLQAVLHEASESNELRENIMYSLAHDLRSPLSNVINLVNLLKQHKGYTENELKWLEMIEISTVNSNSLVNDLLESNELMKQQVDTQLQDLNVLIENVVVTSRIKAASKNITIDFHQNESICLAKVDLIKIDRLVSNLINNAIKFSFPAGIIIVTISKQNNFAIISIKDHGVGIEEKNIDSIFDPFTKAKRKGTNNEVSFGLGLSICKQITILHGGHIKVISELGKGAEFIVHLPISV